MQQADKKALDLVRTAAECGVREAQAIYGQMLLDGKLVERNPTFALHWFERAAMGGDVMAINMVGRCLDQGWGVAASPHLAAPWFRKAAERGLDWGMYNLATLLTLGSGVPEDKHEALYWFGKASDLGHAKSINLVGGFYEDGWVVEQDLVAATEWYRRAAIEGDFRGQFNYARMLIRDGQITYALSWLQRVPETATPAFLAKMKRFLEASPMPALQTFAANLTVQEAPSLSPSLR
jgi:TPR repeat protein